MNGGEDGTDLRLNTCWKNVGFTGRPAWDWEEGLCLWIFIQGPNMSCALFTHLHISQNSNELLTHLALAVGGRTGFGRESKASDEVNQIL